MQILVSEFIVTELFLLSRNILGISILSNPLLKVALLYQSSIPVLVFHLPL
jgi:hypothetical protein